MHYLFWILFYFSLGVLTTLFYFYFYPIQCKSCKAQQKATNIWQQVRAQADNNANPVAVTNEEDEDI